MTLRRVAIRGSVTAGLAIVSSAAARAQTLGGAPDTHPSWLRLLAALAVCIGLAVAGALVLRMRIMAGGRMPQRAPGSPKALWSWPVLTGRAGPGRLVLQDTLRISPQLEVCLFSADGLDYLVVASPGAVALRRTNEQAAGEAQP